MGMQSLRFADNRTTYKSSRDRPSAFIVGLSLLVASSVVAMVLGALKYGLFESFAR